jgi:hypothetical protein
LLPATRSVGGLGSREGIADSPHYLPLICATVIMLVILAFAAEASSQ